MNIFIKHPNTGRFDTFLTLSVYALGVVLVKFLVSDISIGPLIMPNIDAGVVAAILTPTLGALAFKKHSDNLVQSKAASNDQKA